MPHYRYIALLFAAAACAQDLSQYLQRMASTQLAARRAGVDAITTREGYEKRKARLRAAALRMIGGLDDPRSPLNARVTGTLQRDGYRVEKVVYESRPKFYVTANLYVPTTGTAPHPAILQPVGHSTSAKNRAFYQRIAISLVKTGFVVLTYDPVGQGERRIFWDPELGDSKVGGTTAEHSMVGWQSLLGGESVARYRIWDGMRGIDYLLTRPEVDGARIGITGCSGGGTMTTYIAALDDRVKAAAPACYISAWEEQLQGTGPQDAEQQFPDQLLEGLNHADWIGLAAPKPYLIVSTDQDFFPLEGARRSFTEMKRIYTLYDAAAKVDWFHEPGGHGVPAASRMAICSFMKQWLRGEPGAVTQPEYPTEHEEDLNVTPTGQVATSLGGETASTWNTRRFRDRVPARRPVANLEETVLRLTRYAPSKAPLNVRRAAGDTLAYDSDEGLPVEASLRGDGARTALCLNAKRDAGELVRLGYTVLAIEIPAAPVKDAWLALMVGRPLVGIRMGVIVRALDALGHLGKLPAGGVLAVARGSGAAVALLHAATLDRRIATVIAEQSLVSYRAVGASPIHRGTEEIIVPGVLGRYDLPDLASAIAPRPVMLVNPVSPTGQIMQRADAAREYASGVTVALRREEEPLQRLLDGVGFGR